MEFYPSMSVLVPPGVRAIDRALGLPRRWADLSHWTITDAMLLTGDGMDILSNPLFVARGGAEVSL
jgi:hypothetical protein